MAERRMFAKTIIDSDAFLDMPSSAQLLYFHLSMRADDDGFINNPKKIQRMTGAGDDDAKILVTKKFIIPFETGVVVIKHWNIHNYIAKDRYHETKYKHEKSLLGIDENKAYTTCIQNGIQPVNNPTTQVRLGKVSQGKDKEEESDFSKVPDFEDDIEDAFQEPPMPSFGKTTIDSRLAIISESWKRHPELPRYVNKLSTSMKADTINAINAVLQAYTDSEIMTAIDNYAQARSTIEPKYQIQSFQNFVSNSGAIAKYQEVKSQQTTSQRVCPICHGKLKNGQYCKVCEKFFDENGKEMYI